MIQKLNEKKKAKYEKKVVNTTTKNIFKIKKYFRNGLLEKKMMKNSECLKVGKWSKDEHNLFITASLKYGDNWKKVNNH